MRLSPRAALLGLLVLSQAGCPSATVAPTEDGAVADAGRAGLDAAPVATDAAGPEDDAALDPVDAADDAGTADDAATADATADDATAADAGEGPRCAPPGRQYVMAATAQNAQTVTFGAGLPTERTVELLGGYVASFGPSGCFEWLARFSIPAGFIGGARLAGDADGNTYFALAMGALDLSIYDADDRLGARFVATTTTSTTVRPGYRGLIIGSYDRRGQLRWVERMGNAASAPANNGFTLAAFEFSGGALRISGNSNGGRRSATDTYEVVFGEGQPTETRVRLIEAQQFGFLISLDPRTGAPVPGSLRINGSRVAATNTQLRHEGEGAGRTAADGSFAVGMLMVAPSTYQLNRGQPDQTTFATTGSFVAAFTRYTRTGTLAWYRLAGNVVGGMALFSTTMLADGSSLFSGNADEAADFDDGAGGTNLVSGATGYMARYDRAGRLVWLRGIQGRGLTRMLVDEARGALYATSEGTADITFGVGTPDAVTHPLAGAFVARFDLATGALVWIRTIEGSNVRFTSLAVVGDELIASTRVAGRGTFNLGAPDELVLNEPFVWSGNARYDVDDGAFRGVIEYMQQGPVRSVDGLTDGLVIEP